MALPIALAIVAAAAAVTLLLVRPGRSSSPPQSEEVAPGATQRARFDTLYNRAIRASEEGDLATLSRFGPEALAAYRSLPNPDVDARYHAAMLRLATGDVAGAAALADSIAAAVPSHLFVPLVREAVARRRGDGPAAAEQQRRFLAGYEAEMGAGRVEYVHHRFILDQTLAAARQGGEGGGE